MVKHNMAFGVNPDAMMIAITSRDQVGNAEALQLMANAFITMCVLTGQKPSDMAFALDIGRDHVEKFMSENPQVFGPKGDGGA